MLKRIAGVFVRQLAAIAGDPTDDDAPPAPKPEALDGELVDLRRQKAELFDLVVRMERQRDDWKERFFVQSQQHQNAQAALESHIMSVGTTLVAAVVMLNELRTKAELEPISTESLRDLAAKGERVLKSSAEYGEAMRSLATRQPARDAFGQVLGFGHGGEKPAEAEIDGDAERKRIVAP